MNILPWLHGGHRIQNPAGFYSEDWDQSQQEADNYQVPDKWQRKSQMVADTCKYILPLQNVYQDPVLNTKDVAHGKAGRLRRV